MESEQTKRKIAANTSTALHQRINSPTFPPAINKGLASANTWKVRKQHKTRNDCN